MVKINPSLKGKFEATDKVIGSKFEHRYLGVIDMEKINIHQAAKLVKTGHLKEVKENKEVKKPLVPSDK